MFSLSCKEENKKPGEVATNAVTFVNDSVHKKVDVFVKNKLFTSYIYDGQTPKPILYPIHTKSGKTVTRGFPFSPRPNERIDHPHHAGLWLNYGDVNGLDFWNNSYAIPDSEKGKYGAIVHQEILDIDEGEGLLRVRALWRSPDDADLLEETTQFIFSEVGNTWLIDRTTTLKSFTKVSFKDNKEGMIGIRVARELELPTEVAAVYTDAEGNMTEVKALNNDGVRGNYFGSEGLTGNDVWGTRNKWVKLESLIEGDTVSVTIMDHQKNIGYPTYWHARDYGLFAANPLGQAVFSQGKESLNLVMNKGDVITFKYRIMVHNGSALSHAAIQSSFDDFNEL